MPVRLTSILERWRANHGPLEQLVDQIEAAVLVEAEAWVAVLDDDVMESAASATAKDSPLEPVLVPRLRVPAHR
jgi:hypothetical protein